MRGLRDDRVGQRVAVRVRAAEGDCLRRVFRRRRALRNRKRRIVCRRDIDGDRGNCGIHRAVVGLEGEAVGTVVIGGGQVGQICTGAAQRAVRGRDRDRVGQRITIHVAARERDSLRGVFERGDALRSGQRRIVHRVDGEGDDGQGGVREAVVGAEPEGVAAVVIGRGRVSQIRRGAGERAVRRAGGDRVAQRIAIHVGGRERDWLGDIFRGGDALRIGNGRGVRTGGDVDCDGCGGAVRRAVVDLEGERVVASDIEVRRVNQAGCRAAQGSLRRLCHHHEGQRVAVCVGTSKRDCGGDVLVRRHRLRTGERHVIHGADGDGNGGRWGIHRAIVCFEGEAVAAVIVCRRRVSQVRRGAAQRAVRRCGGHRIGQCVAVHIRRRDGDRLRCVLGGCHALRDCDGRIVRRRDRDGDGGNRRIHRAVVRLEAEAVAAVVVRGRGVSHIRRGTAQRSVRRRSHDQVCQRIAIRVTARERDPLGGVLGGGDALRAGERRVIHRGNSNGDRGRCRIHRAVVRLEAETVVAVVVCRRRVSQVRGRAAQRAVRRRGGHRVGQRIAIRIRRRHRHRLGRVFGGRHALRNRDRRIVCRRDVD